MAKQEILYCDRPGPSNTDAVAETVRARCAALGIEHVVVASNSGATAIRFADALKDTSVKLIAVTSHVGFHGDDTVDMVPENRRVLEDRGVTIVTAAHALSGVGRSISNTFGGTTPVEIVAHTLRRFGQGIKVTVEIAVMAADAGAIPTDREVIAVGGSGKGADAAVVIKPAHMNTLFDLEIREILAMVRGTG